MRPKLSVVLPNFNDKEYLSSAIESILGQTWGDFEFILLDDASTDGSQDLLIDYQKRDSRIRLILRKSNQGCVLSNREGAEAALAPFVHGIGADDVRDPTFFEECMGLIEKRPELALVWTQFDWGKERGEHLETCGFEQREEPYLLTPEEAVKRVLHHDLKLGGTSAVYHKGLAQHLGGYDDALSYLSDWFLFHQILFHSPSAFIPKSLCFFGVREDGRNLSNTARHDKKRRNHAYFHLLRRLKESPDFKDCCRRSGFLVPLFHDLFWKLLFDPRYLTFWPYIAKRYPVWGRVRRSLGKHLGIKATVCQPPKEA